MTNGRRFLTALQNLEYCLGSLDPVYCRGVTDCYVREAQSAEGACRRFSEAAELWAAYHASAFFYHQFLIDSLFSYAVNPS